jgi:hypothetical protein
MYENEKCSNTHEPSHECTENETISFNGKEIPEELKKRLQWVLWKLEQKDGRLIKVPCTVRGYRASVKDPKTWTSYEAAHTAFLGNGGTYSGLGLVLTGNDPFIFFDWDGVRDVATGDFDPEIWEEIASLQSYAEISQSGTGAHVIAKGTIPGSRNRSGCREMYTHGRFVAITGNHIEGTPLTVNEAPESAIKTIYQKIDPTAQKSQSEISKQKQPILKDLHYSDEEIIELCKNATNGEKFKELFYKGNWQGHYKSQSEADLALCSLIAFYTKDPEQVNRIFRSSGLYRDKWDGNNGSYRTKTIEKALDSINDIKGKLEVSKQETVLREPYIITKDRIYLNVMDKNGHHIFAYLGDNNQMVYSPFVTVEGRTVYPQELPQTRGGKTVDTVGVPLKDLLSFAQLLCPMELCNAINSHIKKYVDAPDLEIEMFINYILFTWFYKKLNTVPYLRFIGDTGKGKSRMLDVIADLCFYPVTVAGNTSPSGVIRFNELWHGTLKMDEGDRKGGLEDDFIKYLNLGFEAKKWFFKTNPSDYTKQEFFDPFGPKIIAMRRPFHDNATEGRLLSFSVRETTNPDIPVNLPPEYTEEVEELRALIAKFVLFNWTKVDAGKQFSCKDMNIEPRLKQLVIPLSIVLQLMPDKEEGFKKYILRRQEEVTKTRSESWEGMLFNYMYELAIGNERPEEGFEEYFVDGKVVAITASMVAKKFNSSARSVTQAISSIGIITDLKTVTVHDNNGNSKGKKTRMYVVRDGAIWREIIKRYLDQGSEPHDVSNNYPECPEVLRAKGYHE